ncbi:MAG: VOC family protein [Phycisphaerales bacterium]|nr:VOC family protein [Phycisphaerales bacterium]
MMTLSHTIVYVTDMARSTEFYRDVIGFPIRKQSPVWTEFDTGTTILALHATPPDAPPNPATPSPLPGAGQIGLTVPDLDSYHERLFMAGVRCTRMPKREVWGTRIGHYLDPDGMAIAVSERRH